MSPPDPPRPGPYRTGLSRPGLAGSAPRRPAPSGPNWFIALPVAAGAWYDAKVPAPPPGLRRFDPADLHLTVAFLGAVDEGVARRAWSGLPALGGPWAVRLGAARAMGNPRRYSALAAVLAEGAAPVEEAMSRGGAAALVAAGLAPDPRPVLAHLTLARPTRRATEAERAAGLDWARGLGGLDVPLVLDRVALYTWSEARAERLFRIVEERRL